MRSHVCLIIAAASLLCTVPLARADADNQLNTATHWWLQQDLQRAKAMLSQGQLTEALSSLLDSANAALKQPIQSVVNKTLIPPSGNKHDYTSVAIYNWPCNATPPGCKPYPGGHWPPCDNSTGLPWRPCDGIRDEKAITEGDSPAASAMLSAMQTLTLAAYFTGNSSYADRACQQLDAWLLDPNLYMTPCIKYGQSTPGENNGSASGMIEWTGLAELVDTSVLLQSLPCWSAEKAGQAQAWFGDMLYYIWVSGSSMMNTERNMPNNHGTWYDSTTMSLALTSNNASIAKILAENIASVRIDHQILPTGEMPEETARTNAAGYCIFNLEAFSHSATLANWSGVNVWEYESSDGRSVRKAIDFLIPFALNQKPWPYPAIDKVDWSGLLMPLRYASIAYSNQTYEEVACVVSGSVSSYLKSTINLTKPPIYNVTSDCQAALGLY